MSLASLRLLFLLDLTSPDPKFEKLISQIRGFLAYRHKH
ncbi:hypothetical protein PG_0749 [Porphyromonas gingivalis W83]|uniref:Uncharacterized protein n=2 Tax=Porphyromonas gingivalis TaxID=837 RepID=Q7MW88_PORGI|nr:hypothetical protein PG_0749 [Porphyromonas gingivalis W83]EIW94697.1 hypothetical protein HMPREF1322_0583 [Porphyromonas gingivalis W50]BAG33295.1 conserved hypothetical protein [Porphyromonas gingivalis ATCC 33277]